MGDIIDRLKEVFNSFQYGNSGEEGWNKDQLDLYNYLNKWDRKDEDFIILRGDKNNINRLCRSQFRCLNKKLRKLIIKGHFTDYHALRPYEKYKDINDKIVNLLFF